MADLFAHMLAPINLWQEPLPLKQELLLSLCYGAALWDEQVTPEQIEEFDLK